MVYGIKTLVPPPGRSLMTLFFPPIVCCGLIRGCTLKQGGARMAQLVVHSLWAIVGSSPTRGTEHFGFPPVLRDWVIKGLGMSSRVYATGHIKDPVPLIKKGRGLSPGGRFPPSFNHQVIITGLYDSMFLPWRWPQMPTGRKTPTQTLTPSRQE